MSKEPLETNGDNDFEHQSRQKPRGLLAEFWEFLVLNKRWWLIPIVLSLVLFGLLLVLAGQSVIAPLIYPLF